MLYGKNIVMVDGKPGKEYQREYFTHAETDEVENYGKTSKGHPVKNPDGTEWQGIRPKGNSKASVNELLQSAVDRLVERYPLKGENLTEDQKKEHPLRLLLEAVDYGADLWQRGEIQASLNVGKPIDKQAGIAKLAKTLQAMNPKLSAEKALKMATAMSEDEGETEEVAA